MLCRALNTRNNSEHKAIIKEKSMSIFVDPNVTFPIFLKYEDVYASNGAAVGIRILPDNSEGDGVNVLVCDAVGRDFDTMSSIMEEATIINHISGKPMVRASILCRHITLRFFRSWNLKEFESENYLPIESELVGKMHYNAVKSLARKWLKVTGGRLDQDYAQIG